MAFFVSPLNEFPDPETVLDRPQFQKFFPPAVRPAAVHFTPREGYRREELCIDSQTSLPILLCALSREKILEFFYAIIAEMGDEIHAELRTAYETDKVETPQTYYRENLHNGTFRSCIEEYEDILLNDGAVGIKLCDGASEVELTRDKIFLISGEILDRGSQLLAKFGIIRDDTMTLINDVPRWNHTSFALEDGCADLRRNLAFTSPEERNDDFFLGSF